VIGSGHRSTKKAWNGNGGRRRRRRGWLDRGGHSQAALVSLLSGEIAIYANRRIIHDWQNGIRSMGPFLVVSRPPIIMLFISPYFK
jgi:hypothetical protein